jgi:hypothetical protein
MYQAWAERMNNAGTAKERAAIVEEIRENFGVSEAKAYKELRAARKNGKATMPVDAARSILLENGFDIPIGNSRLHSLLWQRNLAITDARARTPHQWIRSEYPNQIHQTDPSVAQGERIKNSQGLAGEGSV